MELLIYTTSSECNALAFASLLRTQIASIHIKNYMLSSLRWDSNPGQTQANILPLYQLSYRGIYKRLQRESNSYLYCDRVASYPLDHAAKKIKQLFLITEVATLDSFIRHSTIKATHHIHLQSRLYLVLHKLLQLATIIVTIAF